LGVFKRGLCPLFYIIIPLPLGKGKGIKGIGFPHKKLFYVLSLISALVAFCLLAQFHEDKLGNPCVLLQAKPL